MCVICFSPKGVDAPTEEQIKDMFEANSDGAGYAYNGRNGKVFYKKGFMKVEDLLKELEPLKKWKNKNLAIHFRIGTAGKNDAATCHPFKITSRFNELRETKGVGPVLFHNGILSKGGELDANSSDTQDFVAAFAPLLKKFNKSKVRDKWIEEITDGNKLLIMYDKNKYKLYGKWEKDGELFVSNLNYKWDKTVKKYEARYYPYGHQYGWDYDDLYYGGYSSFWARKEFENEKNEVEEIFETIEKENETWLDPEDLEFILEWADSYTDKEIKKGDKIYGYDMNTYKVWYKNRVLV